MYDLLIYGGRIVDGTANPWYHGDIGVSKGKIEEIGNLSSEKAEETINAEGLVVCPGFIDIHSHADLTFFGNPAAISKVAQGVTTEVVGNCGMSLAPVKEANLDQTRRYLESISLAVKPDWSWRTMGDYMRRLEEIGMGVNQAVLFGHGTLRSAVMGFEDRAPTDSELKEMKAMAAEAMQAGAVGMSTGLIYPPGAYAQTEEIIEIAKEAAKEGGMYASHIRGESDMAAQAVEEAIRVGEEADLPVQISHLKAVGKDNWGKSFRLLQLIEEARQRGVEVTSDVYPYTAGSGPVTSTMPPWALEGGTDHLLERLRDPELRTKIRHYIETDTVSGWENLIKKVGFDNLFVSFCRKERNKKYEGKSIAEIARIASKDPYEAWFDFLVDDEAGGHDIEFYGSDHDLNAIMSHPLVMFCTDMWTFGVSPPEKEGKPHPRAYGTYPRVLGRYVREMKIISLEEAIRKMTSAPARKIGIYDRGILRPGAWADIAIINSETIIDKATYAEPHQFPVGVEYVIVNGTITVEHGKFVGKMAGKVLKRQERAK